MMMSTQLSQARRVALKSRILWSSSSSSSLTAVIGSMRNTTSRSLSSSTNCVEQNLSPSKRGFRPEVGILFSAPCLDPRVQQSTKERMKPHDSLLHRNDDGGATSSSDAIHTSYRGEEKLLPLSSPSRDRFRPEVGILFSAPCLDPRVQESVKRQTKNEKDTDDESSDGILCGDKNEPSSYSGTPGKKLLSLSSTASSSVSPRGRLRPEIGLLFSAPCLDPRVRQSMQEQGKLLDAVLHQNDDGGASSSSDAVAFADKSRSCSSSMVLKVKKNHRNIVDFILHHNGDGGASSSSDVETFLNQTREKETSK